MAPLITSGRSTEMTLKRGLPPSEEPITLDEAKSWLRVVWTNEDDVIKAAIAAARAKLETLTGRAFTTQTVEEVHDAFPSCGIRLARAPVQAVASVKYIDVDGVEQTLSPALYDVDRDSEPGWILPVSGVHWPRSAPGIHKVSITYTAGYGTSAEVPPPIKQAVKFLVAHLYANREATDPRGEMAEIPLGISEFIEDFRLYP